MSTLPESGSLGNMTDDLGSLAQSARTKQLKTARGILYFVGILTMVVNGALFIFADKFVDWQIEKELAPARAQHQMINQQIVQQIRDRAIRSVELGCGIAFLIGIVFIICAVMVYTYPVASTVTSLVLYLGAAAGYGVIDPTTLLQGWWVKILIVVGLFKAVQAALAYESERKAAAASSAVPGPQTAMPEHLPLKF
jgi:predicted PurR-regulated permease PerM